MMLSQIQTSEVGEQNGVHEGRYTKRKQAIVEKFAWRDGRNS
jgi:hypothetical protein